MAVMSLPLAFIACLVGGLQQGAAVSSHSLRRAAPAAPANASQPQPRPHLAAGGNASHAAMVNSKHSKAPCECETSNPTWTACGRTTPKCVFIDLGAADGNSFHHFVSNGFGPVGNCPSGQWEAYLVEANPRFDAPLQQLSARFPGAVQVATSTAAFDCEATTTFYLDTTNTQQNYWGSSLSAAHPDVQKSGLTNVSVKLMNLNRLLFEKTIPGDWVMVKMDIEGAEWDVVPCLSRAPAASLVDRLYMEVHSNQFSLYGTTQADMESAKAVLRHRGVDIPPYFSDTL